MQFIYLGNGYRFIHLSNGYSLFILVINVSFDVLNDEYFQVILMGNIADKYRFNLFIHPSDKYKF